MSQGNVPRVRARAQTQTPVVARGDRTGAESERERTVPPGRGEELTERRVIISGNGATSARGDGCEALTQEK